MALEGGRGDSPHDGAFGSRFAGIGAQLPGFTTLSCYSRLCVAFPAAIGPGTTMHTRAREIHAAGLAAALESVPLADAGTALLVSAGAGITVAAAVYRG